MVEIETAGLSKKLSNGDVGSAVDWWDDAGLGHLICVNRGVANA